MYTPALSKILVVGATGQQGGAVVDHLLAGGHEVSGLTRDPSSAAAGDDRTLESMAESFGDHLGTAVEPIHVDVETYRAEAGDELADMYRWFNEVGSDTRIESLPEQWEINAIDFDGDLAASDYWRPARRGNRNARLSLLKTLTVAARGQCMHPRTRRGVLTGVSGLLAGTAGCGERGSSPDSTTPTAKPTATPTPAPERISLEPRDPSDIDDGVRIAVHPPMLQRWLRETATSDGPLRVHAAARVQSPTPPLLAFDRIRLAGAGDDANGPYALRATGGTRYRYLAGAEAVTPPANATVIHIDDLSPEQRRLVRAAVASDDRARFYPETEHGEWARTVFFDGYVHVNDTVYRGYELQQTDTALFSEAVWYVLDLESVREESGPILHLGAVDGGIREVIDALLGRRSSEEPVSLDAEGLPQSVIRFVAEHDFLLTHGVLLAMRVE